MTTTNLSTMDQRNVCSTSSRKNCYKKSTFAGASVCRLILMSTALILSWIGDLASEEMDVLTTTTKIVIDTTNETTTTTSPYVIIIDGGSTGSRLHIFEFIGNDVVRRGSARADLALSIFGPSSIENPEVDPTTVSEHLIPSFRFAAKQIPSQYHATTSVQYQATAGMRLLEEWQQKSVYDSLHVGLMNHPDFVFSNLRRTDIQTLSGELEGYYGAVAANYLHGTCMANLSLVDDDSHPIGALDMGGSSTQIVFIPKQQPQNATSVRNETFIPSEVDDCSVGEIYGDIETQTCRSMLFAESEPKRVSPLLNANNEFFSTSYLSYGVDQFRERLWTTWVEEHETMQQQTSMNDENCDAKLIVNPCAFPGHTITWMGYTLVGSGDAGSCMLHVQRLIPHPFSVEQPGTDSNNKGSIVGGISHPSVDGQRFVAMSLFYFALDSLRELSGLESLNDSWPNPSIQELVDALPALCTRNWHDDLHKIQDRAHMYTRAEVLPHRCLETVYIVTLLRDGFGFAPESRSITFLYETEDGNEVEWTLGMALALRANVSNEKEDTNTIPINDASEDNNMKLNMANNTTKEDDDSTKLKTENSLTSDFVHHVLLFVMFSKIMVVISSFLANGRYDISSLKNAALV